MATPFDATTFCTDEDVAAEASSDFIAIAPETPVWASGTDGVILLADPWVLTSALADFEAQAVPLGAIVILESDEDNTAYSWLSDEGKLYAVGSASGHDLTLRQPGLASSEGEPPGSRGDMELLRFTIPALYPIRLAATNWVRKQLNFDQASDLITSDDLKELTVYEVLRRLYRQASKTKDDYYYSQAERYEECRDEVLMELQGRRRGDYATDWISIVPIDL